LAFCCGAAPSATVAVDSRAIFVFTNNTTGAGDIYTIARDGSSRTRLTTSRLREETPTWSADGRSVVFARGTFRYSNLLALRGNRTVRLTNNRYCRDRKPGFASNGSSIAFERGLIRFREVWQLNVQSNSQKRVVRSAPGATDPDLSPDGRRIVFVGNVIVINGRRQGVLQVADPSGVRRLGANGSSDFSPSWSPDGKRIAFARDVNGNRDIYVVAADGSNLERVTDHPAADIEPTWSPDGTQVAFSSDRDGDFDLYTLDLRTDRVAQLTNAPGADREPDWRPTRSASSTAVLGGASRSPDICQVEQRRLVRLSKVDAGLRGAVGLRDRLFACRMRVPVILERFFGAWRPLQRALTDDGGNFLFRMQMPRGTYRVVAPQLTRHLPAPDFVRVCLAARSRVLVTRP